GNDEGEEGSFNGTVVQALLLMNGQEINKAINDRDHGTVAAVLKMRAYSVNAAPAALHDLYLAALSRPPSKEETAHMLSPKMFLLPRGTSTPPSTPQFWNGYYQDI